MFLLTLDSNRRLSTNFAIPNLVQFSVLMAIVFGVCRMPLPQVVAQNAESEVDLKQAAERIVMKTNSFREVNQLEPVRTNAQLEEAARLFAKYMARTDKYGHHADGQTPAKRAQAVGYDYCVVRENIGYLTDPSEMSSENAEKLAEHFTQGWIDSPDHRENMLADYITETGVALATTDGVTYFAVQMFGRPQSRAYRVTIENNSGSTWSLRIESNGGADEVELSPRMRLRTSRCFPVTLSIPGESTSLQIKASTVVNIIVEQGKPMFQTQAADE